MKVPAFTAGGSLDSMKPTFEKLLEDACRDGTMCVKINYDVHPAENDESCRVEKVQPSETVNRNSTLTVTITCRDKKTSSNDGSTTTTTSS